MNIVFDIKNIMSLLSIRLEDLCYYNYLIHRGLDVVFNFREEDLNKAESEKIGQWLMKLASGKKVRRNLSIKNERLIDTQEIRTNFVKKQLTSPADKKNIYFLDSSLDNEHIFDLIIEKGNILLGKIGEETRILDLIDLDGNEIQAIKTNWIDYCPSLPLTDIIICDNHFFKSKERFDCNIDNLLQGLCKFPVKSSLNCVIITNYDQIDDDYKYEFKEGEKKRIKEKEYNKILSPLKNKIERKLKELTGSSCNVTIVLTYKVHDRNIITNYYRIKVGSTVQINDPGTKSDITLEIKSNSDSNSEEITNQLLVEYQNCINNKNVIIGDCCCNFLKFP